MAVDYSGPGGQVINIKQVNAFLRQLNNLLVQGGKAALSEGVKKLEWQLKQGIRSNKYGVPAISQATELTRKAGKTAGLWPARPRHSGTTPLYASGAAVRAITHQIISESLARVWIPVIAYSPTQSYCFAGHQEKGYTIRGRYTQRMLNYLHVILNKGGRPRKDKALRERNKLGNKILTRTTAKVGGTYSRRVIARPAWKTAEVAFEGEWSRIVVRNLEEVLRKGLIGRMGAPIASPFAGGEFGM
jgi:hypothetical protein